MPEYKVRFWRGFKTISDRYQSFVLPGGSFDLVCVRAGVPQGSI